MKVGKMRRLGVVLLGGGLMLLLLSFLPQPAGEQETTAMKIERPTLVATEMSPKQPAIEGAALFQAKGCPSCHKHDDAISNKDFSAWIGPDLTNYEPNPEFVRAWLRDPAAIRPDTLMPNLNLSEEEIEALLAFLQGE